MAADELSIIEKCRIDLGRDQAWAAEKLGITQAHYSKVVRGLVPVSAKIAYKCQQIVGELFSSSADGLGQLEAATIEALRTSGAFRELIGAALKMHKKA